MVAIIMLTIIVLLWLVYPVKKQVINFDEKDEIIKVYRNEVTHIKQQHRKGLIDDLSKEQLLNELDKKSAMAMLSVEQKFFAYRGKIIPMILIVLGLVIGATIYAKFYYSQGINTWEKKGKLYKNDIIAGLFDHSTMTQFITQNPQQLPDYCFLMQQQLLAKYPNNPDALANVAQCHLSTGFPDLAETAIDRALRKNNNHRFANFALAELEFFKQQHLTKNTHEKLANIMSQGALPIDMTYLLTLDSYNRGEFDKAKSYIKQLRKMSGGDQALNEDLDRIEQNMSLSKTGETARFHASESPALEEHKKASSPPLDKVVTTANNASMTAKITVSPELAGHVSTPKTLFVIVKSMQEELVAAGKFTLTDAQQPMTVSLSDGQKDLMQIMPMSNMVKLQVTARISQGGRTVAETGDFTSSPVTIDMPQSKIATITIDQIIK